MRAEQAAKRIIPHKLCKKLRLWNIPLAVVIGILVVGKDIYACRTAVLMAVLLCMMLSTMMMLRIIVMMCAPVGAAVAVGKMCAPVGAAVAVGRMRVGICVPVAVCVGMHILTWGLTEQENKGCRALSVAFVHAVAHG